MRMAGSSRKYQESGGTGEMHTRAAFDSPSAEVVCAGECAGCDRQRVTVAHLPTSGQGEETKTAA